LHVRGKQQLPATHFCVPVQPQVTLPPQSSAISPHWPTCAEQVVGLQHWLPLLMQVSPLAQLPQVSLMQPLESVPQMRCCALQLVVGVHTPHTLATPPPAHVRPAEQLAPQLMVAQPLETVPQFLPAQALGLGTQTEHTLATPPVGPQLWPAAHVPPQLMVAQPLETLPQFLPAQALGLGVQTPHTLATPLAPQV
jgi:hypothetical protein